MMRVRMGIGLALLAWAAAPLLPVQSGIAINEDNSHFFISRASSEMTLEGLHAWVDQYADTSVSHLFLCPNSMKASYRSEVWDAIWDVDGQTVPEDSEVVKNWISNARVLHERGLDPYQVWIARCREKGISPWISMRMNDVHDVDKPDWYIHSHFWMEHPEFRRVPGSKGSWVDLAFDYGRPEVREHHMKLIRELFERYDFDGIEMDWMRFGYHFAPGKESEGIQILNDFMKEVRETAESWSEKRGRRIQVGARVPAHPDAAVGLGMDAVQWVRKGWIDFLVPTPFWATADHDIPIELWRERIGPDVDDIILAAGGEVLLRAHPGGPAVENDLRSTYGFAAAALHRGADQIYLFNYMDPEPMKGEVGSYRRLLEEGLSREVVLRSSRRHVVTYRDTVPAGVSNNAQLPQELSKPVDFRVQIGPAPRGGKVYFVIGLAERDGVKEAGFTVRCGGIECTPAVDLKDLALLPGVHRALRYECPTDALRDGENLFAVEASPDVPTQEAVWVEVGIEP